MTSNTRYVLVVGAAAADIVQVAGVDVLRQRENLALLEIARDTVTELLRAHPGSVHSYSTLDDAERAYGLFEET